MGTEISMYGLCYKHMSRTCVFDQFLIDKESSVISGIQLMYDRCIMTNIVLNNDHSGWYFVYSPVIVVGNEAFENSIMGIC